MDIYTYGSGEFISGVLEAVKSLTSGGVILGLLKVMLVTTLLYGLVSMTLSFGGRGIEEFGAPGLVETFPILSIIRTGFYAAVAVYFLLNPYVTTDVVVEDKYDPSQSKVVTSVPMGIAFVGHATSVVGDKMGEVIEELITPVEAVRFRTGGGVAIGPKYLNNLFDIMPPGAPAEYGSTGNIPTRGVVESWFSKCIYYQLGNIQGESPRAEGLTAFASSDFLLTEPKLQQPPFIDPNTPLGVQYYGYPAANETTCNNATAQIIAAWYNPAVFNKWVERFSARLFGTKEDDPTVLPRVYDLVDRYFPNSFLGTQDKLVQLATLNAAYAAYVKFAAEYSDTGAAELAKKKQGGAWLEMARVGTKSLLVMRQIAEACLYLFGAFLPVFMAVKGFSALFKYIKFAFWLQLWIPIFAIFNAISDYNLAKAIDSVSACTGGSCTLALNFETIDKLRTETSQILGYIGLMSMSVPGLAWGLMAGAERLGGMASSAIQSHQAGSVGGKAAMERTGGLTHFTAGTMAGSAAQAGIGQMRTLSTMEAANRYGGLGALGETTAAAMGREMTAGAWQNEAITAAAIGLGSGIVSAGAGANYESDIGRGIGKSEAAKFAEMAGLTSGGGVFGLSEMENRQATIRTDEGVSQVSFGASGNIPVATMDKTNLTYTDAQGHIKRLSGAEGKIVGNKFTVTGIDEENRQKVTLQGTATHFDYENGRINGYSIVSGKGEGGYEYSRTMSVAQALDTFKEFKGTDFGGRFYKGLEGLNKNQAVQVTANYDTQTGKLAQVSAAQGGKTISTDRSDKIKLSNTHIGSRFINEDTHLNIKQHGTQVFDGTQIVEGYSRITNNTEQRIGAYTASDGKTYNAVIHYDPKTKEIIAGKMESTIGKSGFIMYSEKDKDNNTIQHFGVKESTIDPRTNREVFNFRETSRRSINKHGYATEQAVAPDGTVLMSSSRKGEQVGLYDEFKMFVEKGAQVSLVGDAIRNGGVNNYLFGNRELTNQTYEQLVFYEKGGTVSRVVDTALQAVSVKKAGQGHTGPQPGATRNSGTVDKPPLRDRPPVR